MSIRLLVLLCTPLPPDYATRKADASSKPQAKDTTGAAEYHVDTDHLTDTSPAKKFG